MGKTKEGVMRWVIVVALLFVASSAYAYSGMSYDERRYSQSVDEGHELADIAAAVEASQGGPNVRWQ